MKSFEDEKYDDDLVTIVDKNSKFKFSKNWKPKSNNVAIFEPQSGKISENVYKI